MTMRGNLFSCIQFSNTFWPLYIQNVLTDGAFRGIEDTSTCSFHVTLRETLSLPLFETLKHCKPCASTGKYDQCCGNWNMNKSWDFSILQVFVSSGGNPTAHTTALLKVYSCTALWTCSGHRWSKASCKTYRVWFWGQKWFPQGVSLFGWV